MGVACMSVSRIARIMHMPRNKKDRVSCARAIINQTTTYNTHKLSSAIGNYVSLRCLYVER